MDSMIVKNGENFSVTEKILNEKISWYSIPRKI